MIEREIGMKKVKVIVLCLMVLFCVTSCEEMLKLFGIGGDDSSSDSPSTPSQIDNEIPDPIETQIKSIDSTGGTIVIDDSESGLDGVILEIPEGVFSDGTNIRINNYGKSLGFTDFQNETGSNIIGFECDNHDFFSEPIKITIPIDENITYVDPVIVHYDSIGNISFLPIESISDDSISFYAPHFSLYMPWDSSFFNDDAITPFYSFNANRMPFINSEGICYGITTFINWYNIYYELDTVNSGLLETTLEAICSEIYNLQSLDEVIELLKKENNFYEFEKIDKTYGPDTEKLNLNSYKAIIKSLRQSRPVIVKLRDEDKIVGNHSILIYNWNGDQFLCVDSNYTTPTKLSISSNGILDYEEYECCYIRSSQEYDLIKDQCNSIFSSKRNDEAMECLSPNHFDDWNINTRFEIEWLATYDESSFDIIFNYAGLPFTIVDNQTIRSSEKIGKEFKFTYTGYLPSIMKDLDSRELNSLIIEDNINDIRTLRVIDYVEVSLSDTLPSELLGTWYSEEKVVSFTEDSVVSYDEHGILEYSIEEIDAENKMLIVKYPEYEEYGKCYWEINNDALTIYSYEFQSTLSLARSETTLEHTGVFHRTSGPSDSLPSYLYGSWNSDWGYSISFNGLTCTVTFPDESRTYSFPYIDNDNNQFVSYGYFDPDDIGGNYYRIERWVYSDNGTTETVTVKHSPCYATLDDALDDDFSEYNEEVISR